MPEPTEEKTYSSVDDLLSDEPTAEHDLAIGKRLIKVRIPTSYTETFQFDREAADWVKRVKAGKSSKELLPLKGLQEFELAAVYTLHKLCAQPVLDPLQAASLLKDGIKVKAIIKSIESLRTQHLQHSIEDAVEEGKEG